MKYLEKNSIYFKYFNLIKIHRSIFFHKREIPKISVIKNAVNATARCKNTATRSRENE